MTSLVKVSQTTLDNTTKLIGYQTGQGKYVAKADKLGRLRITPHGKRLGFHIKDGRIYNKDARYSAW